VTLTKEVLSHEVGHEPNVASGPRYSAIAKSAPFVYYMYHTLNHEKNREHTKIYNEDDFKREFTDMNSAVVWRAPTDLYEEIVEAVLGHSQKQKMMAYDCSKLEFKFGMLKAYEETCPHLNGIPIALTFYISVYIPKNPSHIRTTYKPEVYDPRSGYDPHSGSDSD
jgi:hypothetical protein